MVFADLFFLFFFLPLCLICYFFAKKLAEELKVPVRIEIIGPIVGTTCGPGVIATFCRGKEVTRYDGDGK